MQRVVFRADGNSEIGLGHVYRSLAFAEMLKEDFKTVFLIKNSIPELKDTILGTCSECSILSDEKQDQELISVIDYINEGDIVVLDGYHFDGEYQKTVRKHCGNVISIDDMHQGHFYSDYILNHCGKLDPEIYDTESYTNLLLGEQYALLRPEFLQAARENNRKIDTSDTLFLSMGGSDFHNLTHKVLRSVIDIDRIMNVNVVIGAANKYYDELRKMAEENPKINMFRNLSAAEMCFLMKKSDIAITPGSGISFEVCAVGMGFISGYYTENQQDIVNWLDETGCASIIGNFCSLEVNDIRNYIKSFLDNVDVSKMVTNQQIVDGYSDKRLRNFFQRL
ncbi:UDP-2,4-diacetamido-2,4,6-trideoxy-beta-L-altropyranose hydrolase [Fodinibius roseus]|uniref:UDP-2,4-diacetamido-2,4,6-trideoxy-beta-L-altropyranose hydrolase n=1 Tax=Fodinibius roseus TaxID=1194090 RepID=A0A1M5J1N9_9BACT|nr:UDP-2,4-diacetamido-2,4,6-trideoxy-beta-L-altropyranose hydrolase [Fodinibius roseus]SHG34285.1 UDP-2,4-diacetamido-2,4,6-trideoxy-beta-L-altropyranose hydrolase [Fodinibius roseus]